MKTITAITKKKQTSCHFMAHFQVHTGEPVLSRRDLLEHPIDFYEPEVLPNTQENPVVCFTDMVSAPHV